VWKPAAVMDSVARTALSRRGTAHGQHMFAYDADPYILLLPLRITVSSVAMKSVMTASASCRPARTEMMSELGFVYFLVRAASRKTVKVWPVSLGLQCAVVLSYLKRDLVRGWFALLYALYGPAHELLGMRLDVQHLVWRYRVDYALQA
jgi:hypothetical protein